jgi:hypothetical protein
MTKQQTERQGSVSQGRHLVILHFALTFTIAANFSQPQYDTSVQHSNVRGAAVCSSTAAIKLVQKLKCKVRIYSRSHITVYLLRNGRWLVQI